jgi:hypothetical protein
MNTSVRDHQLYMVIASISDAIAAAVLPNHNIPRPIHRPHAKAIVPNQRSTDTSSVKGSNRIELETSTLKNSIAIKAIQKKRALI